MKEAPDNLISAAKIRMTDVLCEGPILGFVSGNDNFGPYKSSFFNETVLMNQDNTFNFNVSGDFDFSYTLGTTGQAEMINYGNDENFLPLPNNAELKQLVTDAQADTDYKDVTVSFNNRTYPDAGSIRITVHTPSLNILVENDANGNPLSNPELNGYNIHYRVDISLNGGPYTSPPGFTEQVISGKTMSGYSKTIEIPLPSDGSNFLSWRVRIRRTTLNITLSTVSNALFVEAVSIISTNTYLRPNTAMVGIELDSVNMGGGIPSRAYEIYGLLVQVPSNYNPVTRAYNGIWLGSFAPSVPQGSNIISNPNFTTDTSSWIGFRSTLSRSTSSPPPGATAYGIATVNTSATVDDPIQASYFSMYQSPSAPAATTYFISGYYMVSDAALNLKIGINNNAISDYTTIGNATTWTAFSTQVTSSNELTPGNWVEFAAQRAGQCLTTDKLYLTEVQVYTPATDGKAYTNNPAWVFYDLCTNSRYGLGNYMKPEWIDKWTLYQIAQYCDVLVDDGKGGQEPRFTCNVVINQQQDAYQVLLQLVSIFRGMLYFANGRLFPVQDALKTFVYQFTNANVLDGVFNYGSSSKRTRHTVALVKWNDPNNFYRETVEYVEDTDGITKYGYQELQMSAFACTSQAQAHRAGKWALVTEALETETVTFKTAIEGTYLRPGDIFQIYDNERYNSSQGGRIVNFNSSIDIVLDRPVAIQQGCIYDLTVTNPRYYLESSGDITGSDQIGAIRNSQVSTARVSTANYTGTSIQTLTSFGPSFGVGSIWNLSLVSGSSAAPATVQPKQYRCLATNESSQYEIEILGLEYASGKFGLIETGFSVINNQVYNDSPVAPPVPGGLSDGTHQRLDVNYMVGQQQDFFRDYFEVDWFPVESSILKFYRVRMTQPGGVQTIVTDTASDTFSINLSGCRPVGQYLFSVTSVGSNLSESAPLTGGYTVTNGNGIASLIFNTPTPITGMYGWPYDPNFINSGFETRSPSFNILRNTGDYDGNDPRFFYITGYQFEFFDTGTSAQLLGFGGLPQEYVTLNSANISSMGNRRTFDIRTTPLTCLGSGLNGFSAFTQRFTNVPPLQAASVSYTSTLGGVNYNIGPNPLDTDISGVFLWSALTTASFTPTFGNQKLSSANTAGTLSLSSTGNYDIWYSLIDSYGSGGCTIYGPTVVNYVGVGSSDIGSGSLTIGMFPTGIQPIQVVTSLPGTGVVGQVVFYTVDFKLYRWNGSSWTTVVDNVDIAANAIHNSNILNGAIDTLKIANSGITAANLSNNAVTASSIAAGSIVAGKLAALSVIAGDLAALSVTAGSISANAITGGEIAAGVVTANTIAANAITANKISAGAIQAGAIAFNVISGANVIAQSIQVDRLLAGIISGQDISLDASTNGVLHSSNFSAGSAGWRIQGNGNAEFNNISARGAITGGAGSSLAIIDVNGLTIGDPANDHASLSPAGGNHTINFVNGSHNIVAQLGSVNVAGNNVGQLALSNNGGTTTILMNGNAGVIEAASIFSTSSGPISMPFGTKIGNGSSNSAINNLYFGNASITLVGGSPSIAFTIDLTNRGFSSAPVAGFTTCVDPLYVIVYNSSTSTSTSAHCTIESTDGSNVPATTTPVSFLFIS